MIAQNERPCRCANEHFTGEVDDFCRGHLLHSLATIGDESSLPIFVYLMKQTNRRDEWRILVAATNYASREFFECLQGVFHDATIKSHKIMAAWGLAKLGNKEAYEYLTTILDEPDVQTANSFSPGESIRVAQAVCDINAWEFEWGKASVKMTKSRLAKD